MALLLALTMFLHLIDGLRNSYLRQQVADLLGVTLSDYTAHQMTYDLRRLRLKGLIYRRPKTNRYFVTPYGWKVARLFSRLEARGGVQCVSLPPRRPRVVCRERLGGLLRYYCRAA
jgi:predicted MarR family transcription regulator